MHYYCLLKVPWSWPAERSGRFHWSRSQESDVPGARLVGRAAPNMPSYRPGLFNVHTRCRDPSGFLTAVCHWQRQQTWQYTSPLRPWCDTRQRQVTTRIAGHTTAATCAIRCEPGPRLRTIAPCPARRSAELRQPRTERPTASHFELTQVTQN